MTELYLRDRARSAKKSVEVVRVFDHKANWVPLFGGFPSMFHFKETPGKTPMFLEGLYIPSGLEMPLDPPE